MAASIRIEDVKAAGLAVDVDALAANGFEAIGEADRYRLKTLGICAQRHPGVFMLRVRVPGGKATPGQVRCVAELCERYGHGSMHVTTRGGLEIHHVALADVRAIFGALEAAGLTTKAACGDTVRNVVACAHAGTFAEEVLDVRPFVRRLHERILETADATNISRKMNVALACSPGCDAHVATSDIGFVATPGAPGEQPQFAVWGAGGLGATPRLAMLLRTELPQHEIVAAFDALVAIGAKYGDRSSRARAKIKLCVDRFGTERMREIFDEELRAALGRTDETALAFDRTPEPARPATSAPLGDAVPQKQPERFTIAALVPMGELASAAARGLACAADRFGDGIVHFTPDQNAELQGVAREDVAEALAAVRRLGLRTRGRGGIADVVACVGLEYCPLAVAHCMTLGEELALAFEARRGDPRYSDFRIHASGCPHSCAKHQVADIGLAGALTERGGVKVEAYVLYLGGNARERRLGTAFASKIARDDVRPVIDALLARYEAEREPAERFSQTVARVGIPAYFETVRSVLGP